MQVLDWQRVCFENYGSILRPSSFRVVSKGRIASFVLEDALLRKGLADLDAQAAEFEALKKRAHSLAAQLKQSVDVLEEDHGKAILVFTIVTTVFLLLSFVTSFLGMNTADIRNMTSNQALFWAIGLPTTAAIVSIAISVAYRGDEIQERFRHLMSFWRKERPTLVRRANKTPRIDLPVIARRRRKTAVKRADTFDSMGI